MERYKFSNEFLGQPDTPAMVANTDGDWVKWRDIKEIINGIKTERGEMKVNKFTDVVFKLTKDLIEADAKNGHRKFGDETASIREHICAACKCLQKYTPGDISDSGLSDALVHTVMAASLTIENTQLFIENAPSDA